MVGKATMGRDTPALFMRLETMIQETGARNAETPPPKKPKFTEVEMAVASIVSEGSQQLRCADRRKGKER